MTDKDRKQVPKSEQESDAHDIDFGQRRPGLLDQHCPVNERKVVPIGSPTRNENDLFLDLIMLQKMVADKESDANCWSRVLETVEQSQREKTEAQLCLLARQKRYLKEHGLNNEVIQMQMDHIRLKFEQKQDLIRSYGKHIQS
ncbi:hypothetical protein AALO_G00108680 [Alosa alosa]|uniref:Uncharacterized protein n=1 Tax=Alosa alosa TaxID=278164 RepID=A0AAV6GSZ8_9TELE|nr:hypothetical protein AALO_G00108680 [Alosa alosa]